MLLKICSYIRVKNFIHIFLNCRLLFCTSAGLTKSYKFVLQNSSSFYASSIGMFFKSHRNLMSSLSNKHSTVSRIISTEDVTTFWKRFHEIFSPQQEKLWDGLLIGLQRYHRVLEGIARNIQFFWDIMLCHW